MNQAITERKAFQMAKRGQPPDGFYTASVTRKKLGNISDGMLRSYLQRGLLERFVPSGRKQGFYKRSDVDRLAREMHGLGEKTETKFVQATRKDIPECVDLLISVFGGNDTTERRQQWLEKNPEVSYLVRSNGKVVGCAFMLPLTPEKIDAVLADQSSSSTRFIQADDILELQPGVPAYLYVLSVGVEPGSELAKRTRGQTLIRGLLNVLFDMGKRGIPVKVIAARSETADGINLMRHVGFTEIEPTPPNRNFIIEVERSGIPEIMRYKKYLREAQRSQM